MITADEWWMRPVYLDDSGLSPPAKRSRLYVLQKGLCGICQIPGKAPGDRGRAGKLFLDHDHDTGLVRGMLCQSCNQREGVRSSGLLSGDYPDVEAYLSTPPAAGLEWLWDFPRGWSKGDLDRIRRIGGISVIEYIRSRGIVRDVAPADLIALGRSRKWDQPT